MSAKDDIAILAKAASIMKDNKRKVAVSDALKKRKVDMVAGKGSFAGGLAARRRALEAGDEQGASKAFKEGMED